MIIICRTSCTLLQLMTEVHAKPACLLHGRVLCLASASSHAQCQDCKATLAVDMEATNKVSSLP